MVGLNAGLLLGLIGFGGGVVTTLVLVLLVVIYNNTLGCNDKKDDDEEENSFIIPMSQIPGAGGMGGYSQADIARAAAMVRAATAAAGPASPEETKKASVGDGNYI
jgi:hypothetical protein